MKKSTIIIALLMVFSSCSIFRNKEKNKKKETIDSVGVSKRFSKSIDTSSFKSYQKVTLYFAPGNSDNSENSANSGNSDLGILNYASGLMEAARQLASSSQGLKDSTRTGVSAPGSLPINKKVKPAKKPTGLGNLIAAVFESGSEQKNGKAETNAAQDSSALKKDNKTTDVKIEGNSKMLIVSGVIAIFITVIIVIFVFLYIKSRK